MYCAEEEGGTRTPVHCGCVISSALGDPGLGEVMYVAAGQFEGPPPPQLNQMQRASRPALPSSYVG